MIGNWPLDRICKYALLGFGNMVVASGVRRPQSRDSMPILFPGRWQIRIEAETLSEKIVLKDDFDVPEQ